MLLMGIIFYTLLLNDKMGINISIRLEFINEKLCILLIFDFPFIQIV